MKFSFTILNTPVWKKIYLEIPLHLYKNQATATSKEAVQCSFHCCNEVSSADMGTATPRASTCRGLSNTSVVLRTRKIVWCSVSDLCLAFADAFIKSYNEVSKNFKCATSDVIGSVLYGIRVNISKVS
ncbi:hypothetical protein GWI33_011531 [Rhynchophorus ferrugineus]|uniref:Uncharacterized protein n=1 Tax=Rhynchophorus ferrugineus TaxID=354439 RepID=A0A834IWL9_RHYFE|nr:hypothetical protein GWI33_011531 [Rhynchophorus ferrugineus]